MQYSSTTAQLEKVIHLFIPSYFSNTMYSGISQKKIKIQQLCVSLSQGTKKRPDKSKTYWFFDSVSHLQSSQRWGSGIHFWTYDLSYVRVQA